MWTLGLLPALSSASFAKIRRQLYQFRLIYLFKPVSQVPLYQLQCIFTAVVLLNVDICSLRTDLLAKGL